MLYEQAAATMEAATAADAQGPGTRKSTQAAGGAAAAAEAAAS